MANSNKKARFAATPMSRAEAQKYINASNRHAGDKTRGGAEFGITRGSFARRIEQAGIQHKLYPKNFSLLEARAGMVATPEQADAMNLAKEKAKTSYQNDIIKQLRTDTDKLNLELAKYRFAHDAGLTPADWTLPNRVRHKSEHMALVFVSDAQAGEVIDPTEVEYGRGYNQVIFRERYRELISTAIYLAQEHVGKDWKFSGVLYIRGGDAVSGGIHEELRETDDLLPLEAARVVFEEEAAGIAKLADFFGRVEVKSVSGGNHDRDTPKRQTKKRVGHNIDALIDFMLINHFKNDKRISFQLTNSTDVIFPIYETNALATHGDNIGSGGGTGYVGPIASITKGVQKIMMEQVNMGRIIHHIFMGHFHQFHHSRILTVNGSFPGFSEFAKSFRMRPEPPTQVMQMWHPKRGLVDLRPIVLR